MKILLLQRPLPRSVVLIPFLSGQLSKSKAHLRKKMTIKIYRPDHVLLKKNIECFYILEKNAEEKPT